MNCEQARTEIIAYLKGELDKDKKKRLEEHLIRCPTCRHELEGARRLLSWTEAASQEAVVKKVEDIIDGAIAASASDIHFEPDRDGALLVRRRIDGVLHEVDRIESVQRHGVTTRIKMLADVDESETSLPQDGRFGWTSGGCSFDVRAAILPTVLGESVVMRILDRSPLKPGYFEALVPGEEHRHAFERVMRTPCGLFVTSGPSGCGKTTVLYSLLTKVASPELKVVTVEDPVEVILPGVNHTQVNKRVGYTFEKAVRAILRHDPDVMMVGEIRDTETAALALQAALMGHLVLSTVHANKDAVEAIQRLRNLGTDDFLVAGALIGAESQRLVRRVCEECKQEATPEPNDPKIKFFGITKDDLAQHTIYVGKGCPKCRNTGYHGRLALYEILEIDRDLREMIGAGASTTAILEAALEKGFRTMKDDAKDKILSGLTTPEEAFRVLA